MSEGGEIELIRGSERAEDAGDGLRPPQATFEYILASLGATIAYGEACEGLDP